jgi:hypothetical protein
MVRLVVDRVLAPPPTTIKLATLLVGRAILVAFLASIPTVPDKIDEINRDFDLRTIANFPPVFRGNTLRSTEGFIFGRLQAIRVTLSEHQTVDFLADNHVERPNTNQKFKKHFPALFFVQKLSLH